MTKNDLNKTQLHLLHHLKQGRPIWGISNSSSVMTATHASGKTTRVELTEEEREGLSSCLKRMPQSGTGRLILTPVGDTVADTITDDDFSE